MRVRAVLIVALLFSVSIVATVTASTPAADQSDKPAGFYIPSASDIGIGWKSGGSLGEIEEDSLYFTDSAGAVYVGPSGARTVILVYQVAESRIAVQRSWETVGETFDFFRRLHDLDSVRERELSGTPAPDVCVDSRRTEGFVQVYGMPVGVTMCAVGSNLIILTVAEGYIAGHSGVEASNYMVSILL